MKPYYFHKSSFPRKVILVLVFLYLIFNLSILLSSFLIDANDIREMVKMARYISYIKYLVIINLFLFLTIITIYYFQIRRLRKDHDTILEENGRLKSVIPEKENERS